MNKFYQMIPMGVASHARGNQTESGKSNYVVEEFSVERQHAIILWDHYLTTKDEVGIVVSF